ncbi:MAG: hypothetical protein GC193_10925 [Cryomorphaceae bacterium]|nr:hypothetical protein [Cryomorphaceae bacterium]
MTKKFVAFVTLFLLINACFAQEVSLDQLVTSLNSKIPISDNSEKLKFRDSLITLVEFNEEYHYSELITENIRLALKMDSVSLATKHTADYIYYCNSVLRDPEKGLEILMSIGAKS